METCAELSEVGIAEATTQKNLFKKACTGYISIEGEIKRSPACVKEWAEYLPLRNPLPHLSSHTYCPSCLVLAKESLRREMAAMQYAMSEKTQGRQKPF